MARKENELYPDYTAELRELDKNLFTMELLYNILRKHKRNSEYNKKLYDRYKAIDKAVPIMERNADLRCISVCASSSAASPSTSAKSILLL